jgi:hypothetical protein
MISAQMLRVCREEKPVSTFPDHALTNRTLICVWPFTEPSVWTFCNPIGIIVILDSLSDNGLAAIGNAIGLSK